MDETQLQVVCEIAERAGAEVMSVYAAPEVQSWAKADDTPLTQADLRADAVIRTELHARFPDIYVRSEESSEPLLPGGGEGKPRRFFLVDPLDGTKEFLNRNGEFTVNIALIDNGVPVAGVVYAPALRQLYFAAHSLGAFRRDAGGTTALHTHAAPADQPLRIIGSRSHGGEGLASWLQRLTRPHTFVAAGSSLKFCRLAEGAADVYPRHGPTCQWDTAAGQAILECAGGVVLDPQGRELRYGLDRPVLNPFFLALASRDVDVPSLL